MTTPAPDTYRELAEEIARNISDASSGEFSEGDPVYKGALEHWEARLRAALPASLSRPGHELVGDLLGELARIRKELADLVATCEEMDWPARILEDARAALAPGSGRLAGEVIRAAVRNALAERAGEEMEPRTPEEYAKDDALWENVVESRKAFFAAVDAFLAAHPELGLEVEGE